jgi:predicted negative regulator of RcsB-dependent stress response
MSDIHYNSETKEEAPVPTELMGGHAVTQEMTPVEKMIPLEASIKSAATEEKLPKTGIESRQQKLRLRKTTRRKQANAKLAQLLKIAKRNEVEMYEMRKSIESLDRVEKKTAKSNLQLIKQFRLQLVQLRYQVMRIQKDIRRMRTPSASTMKIRKIKVPEGKTTSKLRSKKSEIPSYGKAKRRRRTR